MTPLMVFHRAIDLIDKALAEQHTSVVRTTTHQDVLLDLRSTLQAGFDQACLDRTDEIFGGGGEATTVD